ncbi:ABC transporter substrate-binding protein [Psychromonas sp. Urea-02u-13]|uniref:ABC transporter substrate-binding protein n=1 Tax=Psychromonas sp. Urea-02u-13 TaxID=2058326 RepID=UPI000C323898|nr:ABC transporter substrate binding protein [Psychromonas sp. Urea-02u-13]PKG37435.1 sugar ABC transporter [Psychromonas sp. Urea-02u-13]
MQILMLILFVISISCLSTNVFAKKKVLVIESYHSEFSWDKSYIEGLKSILGEDYELSYFQMDTKRLAVKEHQQQADAAWLHYQLLQPELVILGDDNALKYLGKRFTSTETPVIYLGINNNPRNYELHKSKNITGVLERPLIKRSVSNLSHGKAKKVLILFDSSHTSQTILEEKFANNKHAIISNIQVDIALINDWSTWQEKVLQSAENQYDILFIGLYHTIKDQDNNHIPAAEVLDWTIQNTPIPPFAFWDFSIGEDKAIGGLVLSGYEQGKLAAQMAKIILETSVHPYQLGTQTALKGRYLFSRQQLSRFSITLPEKIKKRATFVD